MHATTAARRPAAGRRLHGALLLLMLAALAGPAAPSAGPDPGAPAAPAADAGRPLLFEPNAGQTDPTVRYLAHAPAGLLFFTPGGVVLQPASAARPDVPPDSLSVLFVGARPAALTPVGPPAGRVSYLLGADPRRWQRDLPAYPALRYAGLYPGIALQYAGDGRGLESTYQVAPGADPGAIAWRYAGAGRPTLDPAGRLRIPLGADGRAVVEAAPVAWQDGAGPRRQVAVAFRLAPDGTAGFALGPYDPTRALTINPTLTYATYLGGSGADVALAATVDAAGDAILTGQTNSPNFPRAHALQPTRGGGTDAFVTELNPSGSALVFSTYLGGSAAETGEGIAVGADGSIYVVGLTNSTNFPTAFPFQAANAGGDDAFVARLTPSGDGLIYSTYLGGGNDDWARGVAVDGAGAAYVGGTTLSANFPRAHALQSTNHGAGDGFISKLTATGSSLVYSTYLGGSGADQVAGIAVSAAGDAYLTGYTLSTNFPTANPFQPGNAGGQDAFVARLNPGGSALVYATYLGGSYSDGASALALDAAGNTYVTGATESLNFPRAHALQPANAGQSDAFVSKLNPNGSALVYSTYLGGSGDEFGQAIALDGAGDAYLTGYTDSTNFPHVHALQAANAGGNDLYISRLDPAGTALDFASYLGDSGDEFAYGLAANAAGDVFVVGHTASPNFPTTFGAFQRTSGGGADAFVARIATGSPPPTPTAVPQATATPGATATPCPLSFADVHPTDYFYQPVLYLACNGVISGYADGTFRPYNNTTRAQMVKIVVLGFGRPVATPTPTGAYTFTDVPPNAPFFAMIETAAADGIISGYACGGAGEPCDAQQRPYFRPNADVTRGQLAKIDVVAAGWDLRPLLPPGTFEDVVPGSAFYDYVETAVCHGVISGYACGGPGEPCDADHRPYFRPGNSATRGQIAKIVYLSLTATGGCAAPAAPK